MLRPATGHDRIYGDLFHGRNSATRRHDTNEIMGATSRASDHRRDCVGCRRDDRKSVARSALEKPRLQLGWVRRRVQALGTLAFGPTGGAGALASAARRLSYNFPARSTTCWSESPPSGCVNTAIRGSAKPSARPSCNAFGWKAVDVSTTVGIPRRSSSARSWRLHDVHEPQSAEPVSTRSAELAISSRSSGLAATAGFSLR